MCDYFVRLQSLATLTVALKKLSHLVHVVEIQRPATTETVAFWRAFYAAYQYSNLNYLIHLKKK